MRRLFMDPREILQRDLNGDGGGVTLEMVNKALDGLKNEAQKGMQAIKEKMETLEKQNATKDEVNEFKEAIAKNQKDIETVNAYVEQIQKQQAGARLTEAVPSFSEEVAELIQKNHAKLVELKGQKVPFEVQTKGLLKADMSFTNNTTGQVTYLEQNPNLFAQPLQTPHIRSYVRMGTMSGPVYNFIQIKKKDGTPNPGLILPGGTKTQLEKQLTGKQVSAIKIAGYVRLPEEMIEDIEGLTSYLQNYLPEDVLNVEDEQMLTGTGEANKQFDGLLTTSPVYAATAGVDANESWDVVADAGAQLRNKRYMANLGLINPIDWMFMATRKSTDGIYSHPTLVFNTPLSVGGIPLVANPTITGDKFLIGDFRNVELKIRKGLTVRFFDNGHQNAIENMVTVVAEERAAMANYYPDSFLQGDFGRVA